MESVRIPLTQGQFALVDIADEALISQWKWRASRGRRGTFYARTGPPNAQIRMHRLILGLPPGRIPQVDHVNHDGLDNRRANLRLASSFDNVGNSRRRLTNRCGYKGVYAIGDLWQACIASQYLGTFDSITDAARAYDTAARLRYGEFASLNFPDETITVPPRLGVLSRANTSGIEGVSYRQPRAGRQGAWVARFNDRGQRLYLGRFANREDAARAWQAKAIELLAPSARLRFPID